MPAATWPLGYDTLQVVVIVVPTEADEIRRLLVLTTTLNLALATPGFRAAAQEGSPATPSGASAATPKAPEGDFTGLLDIGDGRRLWLECRCAGSPGRGKR